MSWPSEDALAKLLSGHEKSEHADSTWDSYQCKGCKEPLPSNSRSAMARHQAKKVLELLTSVSEEEAELEH